jgi:hypothetical protein
MRRPGVRIPSRPPDFKGTYIVFENRVNCRCTDLSGFGCLSGFDNYFLDAGRSRATRKTDSGSSRLSLSERDRIPGPEVSQYRKALMFLILCSSKTADS